MGVPTPSSSSSCAQGKEGYLQALDVAAEAFSPGSCPAYLLESGALCSVDCPGLPQRAQAQPLSCSKGPQQAPESFRIHHTSLGSAMSWKLPLALEHC